MKLTILAVCAILSTVSFAFTAADYKKTFKGEGTYYGGNPFGGNCAIKAPLPARTYDGRLSVAINNKQYEGSCGACIRITGNGKGLGANPIIGPIDAYIADRCYECKEGDIDLGMPGDGRWEIEWTVVPCTPSPQLQFLFEGSNPNYWKLQPRGTSSPVKEVRFNGQKVARTQDNHWVWHTSKTTRAKVTVKTVLGKTYESMVTMIGSGTTFGTPISGPSKDDDKMSKDPKPKEQKPEEKKPMEPEPKPEENMPKESKPEDDDSMPASEMRDLDTRKGRNARSAIKKIGVYLNSRHAVDLYDGDSKEIRTNGRGVSFRAITTSRSVGEVSFQIGDLMHVERVAPYVFPGNRRRSYISWDDAIYDREFTLIVKAAGTTTTVKITLRK